MKKTVFTLGIFLIINSLVINAGEVSKKQIIAGAGPSTKIVQLFFNEFVKLPSANGYKFEIPKKSVKHAGGILSSEKYLFGRTGRPLSPGEKKQNKNEIILAELPIVFAVGSGAGITSLNISQLENIITGKYVNWKQVGGSDEPIINVGREGTEAVFQTLKSSYHFFKRSNFTKIFKKDNDLVNFLINDYGKYAISFSVRPNFENELNISIVSIKDFSATIKLGLVYDLSNSGHPLIGSVSEYARSEEWAKKITAAGFFPPD